MSQTWWIISEQKALQLHFAFLFCEAFVLTRIGKYAIVCLYAYACVRMSVLYIYIFFFVFSDQKVLYRNKIKLGFFSVFLSLLFYTYTYIHRTHT